MIQNYLHLKIADEQVLAMLVYPYVTHFLYIYWLHASLYLLIYELTYCGSISVILRVPTDSFL
jgi:hypothetical protein